MSRERRSGGADAARPNRMGREKTCADIMGGGRMLSVAPAPSNFLHTDAADMRKSFTGLCGLVRSVFKDAPADGSLFLFLNERRDRIKPLWWDGDGFVFWYKRLQQGAFRVVASGDDVKPVRRDATQLMMILGCVRLESARLDHRDGDAARHREHSTPTTAPRKPRPRARGSRSAVSPIPRLAPGASGGVLPLGSATAPRKPRPRARGSAPLRTPRRLAISRLFTPPAQQRRAARPPLQPAALPPQSRPRAAATSPGRGG